MNIDPGFKRESLYFAKDQALSFLYGAAIGGLVSGSVEGAFVSGCIGAALPQKIDSKIHLLSLWIFAATKLFSPMLLGRDLTPFSPLLIGFLDREQAINGAVLTAFSFFHPLEASLTSKSIEILSMAKPITEFFGEFFSYRICQAVFLCSSSALFFNYSGSLGSSLQTLGHIAHGRLFPSTLFLHFVAPAPLYLGTVLASGSLFNYLSGNFLGGIQHLFPVIAACSSIFSKYKLFLLDHIRVADNRRVLPSDHPIEIQRKIQLLYTKNPTGDVIVESMVDHLIQTN